MGIIAKTGSLLANLPHKFIRSLTPEHKKHAPAKPEGYYVTASLDGSKEVVTGTIDIKCPGKVELLFDKAIPLGITPVKSENLDPWDQRRWTYMSANCASTSKNAFGLDPINYDPVMFERFITGGERIRQSNTNLSEFDQLKALLASDEWPMAIDPGTICDLGEAAKFERAKLIMDWHIRGSINDKTFLDFGCGEGHCVKVATERGARYAIGYDPIAISGKYPNCVHYIPSRVGGFDIILMHDVLDHIPWESGSLVKLLGLAKERLSKDGRICVRFHPWISRHGGHLHRKINKAFVHLIFTETELKELGFELESHRKVLSPKETYRVAIGDAGLSVVKNTTITHAIESFFLTNPLVRKRFLDHWAGDSQKATAASVSYHDYVLAAK